MLVCIRRIVAVYISVEVMSFDRLINKGLIFDVMGDI